MNYPPPTQPGQPAPHGNPLPCRETVSNFQFETLFTALETLRPFLMGHPLALEDLPPALDGGVSSSAVATFTRICDRLDSMFLDNDRWSLKQNDALYDAITNYYRDAASNMTRPSRNFRPEFTIIAGEYIAMWGNPKLPGGIVIGKGPTPEAALLDFDEAFTRKTEEQYRLAPASEERLRPEPIIPVAAKKEKR